jgi:plasmid maintenance system antidote protein VapI
MPSKKAPASSNPPHRPAVVVDWDFVDRNLEAGCDGTEVAAALGIAADTLYRHCQKEKGMTFDAYKQLKKARGDSLLKTKQFAVAMQGDRTMLVWLGKQRLSQRDKQEVEHDGAVEIKIIREIKDKGVPG